jgi:superfamily II DNA or RNA helicase
MRNNQLILRDYQREMLGRIQEAWGRYRSVMVQMPTGTGKTVLLAEVIRKMTPPRPSQGEGDYPHTEAQSFTDGGVLIVAHRRELIEQIKETLEAFGIAQEQVRVESIQKLARAEANYSLFTIPFSLIIVDEAHHAVAKSYRWMWERWPKAKFLGLTATPCRLNQTGFTDLFDTLLQSWSIQEFIDRGWLSDFEYISVTPDNAMVERIRGLKKRGVDGDYQTKEMATVMDAPESIEHLYWSYRKYANGKKGIVYAISREHAQHIAAYYQEHGVRCAVIDAKTPAEERRKIVEAYKGHTDRIDVIVNVDIFSEGFDCPDVEFIQLARPTLSLSKYLQQVGRGMRVIPGKDYVIILDQVGMYQTFGMPTEERSWALMFAGKESGKGLQGGERGYVIRDDGNEPTLINLEMVRIKRRGETNTGVEIFMKGGKYGVMVDGRETCRAEYEHISRLRDGKYFALATYPYAVYKGKTTVISLAGLDMRASLYGKVKSHGDVIEGQTISGQRTYWDGRGQRYYSTLPEFEQVGGVDMVRSGGKYMLRQLTSHQREPVAKEDIWYNREILWMKNVIVFKKTGEVMPIAAYGMECFFVTCDDLKRGRYLKVGIDGKVSDEFISYLGWHRTEAMPHWGGAQLVHASSGRMEVIK